MWAGYLALVNQQSVANGNKTLGFINPSLYTIGAGSSYGTDFHDITSGSNGYSATTGYDLATGWGSPNGSGLINALAGTVAAPGFSLSASPGSVSIVQGSSGASTITSTVSGGFNTPVALSASGQPTGVTVTFASARLDYRHGQLEHVDHGRVNRCAGNLSHHGDGNRRQHGRNHHGLAHRYGSGHGSLHHLRLAHFGIAGRRSERIRDRDDDRLRRI